jgi:hypothetical protein
MKVDPVAKRMSEASGRVKTTLPKKGDTYRCETCGMELEVTADCRCEEDEQIHFQCCGAQLTKV